MEQTHSANALALSWAMAREFDLPTGAVLAIVLLHTGHVCLSRLYLGVHSLADVAGGLAVGCACVFAYEVAITHVDQVKQGP